MVAIALWLTGGCRRGPSKEGAPAPPPATTSLPAPPRVDEAAPGELAEGTEQAFGLVLPRRMEVGPRYEDAVFARGRLLPEDVLIYVKQRVTGGAIEVGPQRSVLRDTVPRGSPAQRVQVEVLYDGLETRLVVRDRRRPPAAPALSEEERWKAAGLRPDGKPLDPNTLQ